jgi:excisionase family DNA binding protein
LGSHYLTTGDTAAVLGVTRQTVLRWVRHGILPATGTLGGHLRLRAEDVAAFRLHLVRTTVPRLALMPDPASVPRDTPQHLPSPPSAQASQTGPWVASQH